LPRVSGTDGTVVGLRNSAGKKGKPGLGKGDRRETGKKTGKIWKMRGGATEAGTI